MPYNLSFNSHIKWDLEVGYMYPTPLSSCLLHIGDGTEYVKLAGKEFSEGKDHVEERRRLFRCQMIAEGNYSFTKLSHSSSLQRRVCLPNFSWAKVGN